MEIRISLPLKPGQIRSEHHYILLGCTLLGVWDQNLTLCIKLEAIHFKSTGRPSLLSPASDQNP